MIKSIRHLLGTSSDWAANDIIIPDGEIAIERVLGGGSKLKIGDGEHPFSRLASVTGDTVICEDEEIDLVSGMRYRFDTVSGITIRPPDEPEDDFYCEISFDTPNFDIDFSIVGPHIRMTGDGAIDEIFIPEPYMHYTVFIWYDGTYQGVARGLRNAT